MDKTTRDCIVREMVTNLLFALTDTDPQNQKRHALVVASHGGRLLPGTVRAVGQFFHTPPGSAGSMPGPSGY